MRPERYTAQVNPQDADPARTPISRGTKSSNPLPSSGESRANLSFRAGIASIPADAVLRKAIGEQALAMLRSFRKQGTVEQVGLGRGIRWRASPCY